MTFNPAYVPSGRADKLNEYFKRVNHTRQPKTIRNKSTFLGAVTYSGSLTVGENGASTFVGFFAAGAWGDVSPDTIAGQTINLLRVTVSNDTLILATDEGVDFTSDAQLTVNLLGVDYVLDWVPANLNYSNFFNTVPGIAAALQAELGNTIPVTITYTPA